MTNRRGRSLGRIARICAVISILSTGLSAGRAGETNANGKIRITAPDKVRVRGELVDRMKLAIHYLDLASRRDMWSGFRAKLLPGHAEGMWGADWPGRTLEAYARISMSLGGPCSARYDEIGYGMLAHQQPDGAFHNGEPVGGSSGGAYASPSDLSARDSGFWFGNGRGLTGYLWAMCYEGEKSKFREPAKSLGDYTIEHYFDTNQPGLPSGSFWWVMDDAMAELYRDTGEAKYLDMAARIAESIPPANKVSQHTHSYLMSLRGIVQVCELTGGHADQMEKVLAQYQFFKDHVMWPGGGIIEHLGDPKTFNSNYWYDEGCSVCDWLSLNLALWRVTRDTMYMDMAERVALNHLIYDQDDSGGFCGDRGVDFTREGSPWPFCCAMYGATMLSEVTQYIDSTDGKDVYLNFFYPAKAELALDGGLVQLDLETQYPADGKLLVTVGPAQTPFALKVRVPEWSKIVSVAVDGQKVADPEIQAGYLVLERLWTAGAKVAMELAMPLRTEKRRQFIGDDSQTDYSRVSLWRGPRQLVFNEELNLDLWKGRGARPAVRYAYQTYESLRFNKSVKGTGLRIGSKTYEKGLGTHSVSEIVYALGGEYKEFISDIGIDAAAEGGGAVRFKVCVDGVVCAGDVVKTGIGQIDANVVTALYGFQTAAMTGKEEAKTIQVRVEGSQVLRLCVDDGVNGLDKDYADWGNARLFRTNGSVVYLSDLPDDRKLGLPWDWGAVRLKERAGESGDPKVTTLWYKTEKGDVPARFNYLADLGYSLIKHRPVLSTYMKAE